MKGLEILGGVKGQVLAVSDTTTPPSPPPQGCIPTMARAVVVNAAQLASYSQSKQFLLDSGEPRSRALGPGLARLAPR